MNKENTIHMSTDEAISKYEAFAGNEGIDFSELDKQYKDAYDNRTYWNKVVKENSLNQAEVDESLPVVAHDIEEIQIEVNRAYEYNKRIDGSITFHKQLLNQIESLENELAQLKVDAQECSDFIYSVASLSGICEQLINDNRELEANNKKLQAAMEMIADREIKQ